MKLVWASEDGKEETERTVCQFHYSAWPDHGIPTQVKPLLEMVRLIRDCQVGRQRGGGWWSGIGEKSGPLYKKQQQIQEKLLEDMIKEGDHDKL